MPWKKQRKEKKEKVVAEQIYKRERVMATITALAVAPLPAVLHHCAGLNFLE